MEGSSLEMAIQKISNSFIYLLSTDTKPTTYSDNTIAYEQDTGNMFRSVSGSWSLFRGASKTETLTNKTIDPDSNTLLNLMTVPFNTSTYKRTGFVIPAANPSNGLFGATDGWPTSGTVSSINDSTEGYVNQFNSSTSGAIIGYLSNSTAQLISQRQWNTYIKARINISTTTSTRYFVGFSTNNTLPASDTILASTDSGVLVGFDTTNANFSVYNNDGTAAQVVTSFGVAKATGWHTFEIAMSSSNAVCKLDGGNTQTITTRLPSTTVNIYGNVVGQLAAAASTNFWVKGVVFRSDK